MSFLLLGWLVPLGVGLLPIFGIGVPMLVIAFWFCRLFGALERRRYGLVLGVDIPPPHRPGVGPLVRLREPSSWREAGDHLLRLPLSAVQVTLAAGFRLLPPAALSLPAWNWALPGCGADLGLCSRSGPGGRRRSSCWPGLLLLRAPALARIFSKPGLAPADTEHRRVLAVLSYLDGR